MKNSPATYLITLMLILFFKLCYASEPCQLNQQVLLLDSIKIDNIQAPFVVSAQNPHEIDVYLSSANLIAPHYTRAWIDVNQNGIFESSELIMDHGPDNNTGFTEVVNLPALTPGVDYEIRFAISDQPAFEACESVILDFFDTTLRVNDPFTVRADDSSCPCGYNPQNGLNPICVELGNSVSGAIIYQVDSTVLPVNTTRIRMTVTAQDPFGNPTYIYYGTLTEVLVREWAVSDQTSFPLGEVILFELYNANTSGVVTNNRYNIYITLEALVEKEDKNNDDSGLIYRRQAARYEHIATDNVFIPLCNDPFSGAESHTWKPYPNPTSDHLNILNTESPSQSYQLYDKNGLLVKEGSITESYINLTDLKKGVYLLVLGKNKHLISKQ